MEIEDSNKYGKLVVERLEEFEAKIGSRLPEDYREFLINHNGGKPMPCDFVVTEKEGSDSLHVIYGIHCGPSYANLEEVNALYSGRIPRSLITFAEDPFGNAICIGINGDNSGKVFFWDHELESDDEVEPDYENITLLAESFSEFLSGLYEHVDPNESEVDEILRTNNVQALNQLLESGYDLEKTNDYDRTLIEEAAIKGNNEMIRLLFKKGASLRQALSYAEKNAEFFEEHKSTVNLLKELQCKV
jgi:hypothetical protein